MRGVAYEREELEAPDEEFPSLAGGRQDAWDECHGF